MLNEVTGFIMMILSAVGTGIFLKWFIAYKENKEEDKRRALDDQKEKIHAKFDSESLDKLLDSSSDVYRKLGPPKDN